MYITTLWQHLRSSISSRKSNLMVLFLLMLTLLLKQFVFHITCFQVADWKAFFPITQPLIMALLLASPALLSKKRWWIVVLLVVVDIWMFSNAVYFRANSLFINMDSIRMAGGLHGFEGAILAYLVPLMGVNVLLSITLGVGLYFVPKAKKRAPWSFGLLLLACVASGLPEDIETYKTQYLPIKEQIYFYSEQEDYGTRFRPDHFYGKYGQYCFLPFYEVRWHAQNAMTRDTYYVHRYGPLYYAGAMMVYDQLARDMADEASTPPTAEDVVPYLNPGIRPDSLSGNLVIILLESMESWPLLQESDVSEMLMPNTMRFIREQQEHLIYCTHVRSQVRHGVSADGQMLVNTGFLPLKNQGTCYICGENTWPNLAGHYPNTLMIDPYPEAWNGERTALGYGYANSYPGPYHWTDETGLNHLCEALDSIKEPFCIQLITADTHTPFSAAGRTQIELPEGMPRYMRDYLGCLHYVDSCLGVFFERMKEQECMQRTTLVITGDHTIFKQAFLSEFHSFAEQSGWDVPKEESFCPLFIYSPTVEGRRIDDIVYQMDIYPTLLPILGVRSNEWKGFGIDLLSAQSAARETDTDSLTDLSEKILRSNYFAK